MLYKVLPGFIADIITNKLNYDKVYELRIRAGRPIVVNYAGCLRYLTENGVGGLEDGVIIPEKKLLESLVFKAAEHSMYAVNEQVRNGFLTVAGGYRIGICGDVVIEGGEVKTIKSFSSLNIRIPHEVKNCALNAYRYMTDNNNVYSTLVISPPGGGKTTFLRDVARLIGERDPILNTLIIDERYEIAASTAAGAQLDVGALSDVMSNADKAYGFMQGIRCMSPDVIITDELACGEDITAVINACASGVRVVASVHAAGHIELGAKPEFDRLIKSRVFERYVVLSSRRGPGTYEGIYDAGFNALYYG